MTSLVLGSFNMLAGAAVGSTRVMAEGTSRGNPVPIEVAVKSWLQDGSIVVTQGHDNREVRVRVRFFGDNLTDLAATEALLFAELEKPNTLTWTPPTGPASVFNVITSSLEAEDDDLGEAQPDPWRTYTVRLVCEAFVRSEDEVAVAALPATGSTTTTLDACSAATGWTGFINGVSATVTNASGANSVTQSAASGTYTIAMQKTFAATTTTTKYLVVDWQPSLFGRTSLVAIGDSVTLPVYAEGPSPTVGYVRTWFYVLANSLAVTRFEWTSTAGPVDPPARTLSIDNVAVSDVNPIAGTGRQQLRSLDVTGSAPAPGSLTVQSASSALGDTSVYIYADDDTTTGYSPSLRQFRQSGGTVTPDAGQVSGNTEPLTGAGVTFSISAGLFPPGAYLLLARLATSGGGTPTISWLGRTLVAGVSVGINLSGSKAITTTTAYQTFVLTKLQLPVVDSPRNAAANVVLSLGVSASSTCTYDEMWLYNTTIGTLIRVDCGTGSGAAGGAARRLFIDSPSIETPRPTVLIGHSANRSDAFYPLTFSAWGFPKFKAGRTKIHVVTAEATNAGVSFRYYPRWHSHAAS